MFLLTLLIFSLIMSQSQENSNIKVFDASKTSMGQNNEDLSFGFSRFKEFQNKYLKTEPFKVVQAKNFKVCLLTCVTERKCVSLNYETAENGRCEILSTDVFNNNGALEDSKNHVHFSLRSECFSSPCKNNGLCVTNYISRSYSCRCPECFGGQHCEKGYFPVGMEDGRVQNSQFSASSEFPSLPANFGRLRLKDKAWASGVVKPEEYLQIDLLKKTSICKVATQGRYHGAQYVKEYSLAYSNNASVWMNYGRSQNITIFQGNTDPTSVVCNFLSPPLEGRYVRIIARKWHHHIAMRAELYACNALVTKA